MLTYAYAYVVDDKASSFPLSLTLTIENDEVGRRG